MPPVCMQNEAVTVRRMQSLYHALLCSVTTAAKKRHILIDHGMLGQYAEIPGALYSRRHKIETIIVATTTFSTSFKEIFYAQIAKWLLYGLSSYSNAIFGVFNPRWVLFFTWSQRKKSQGNNSQNLGGQLGSPKREIKCGKNFSLKRSMVLSP